MSDSERPIRSVDLWREHRDELQERVAARLRSAANAGTPMPRNTDVLPALVVAAIERSREVTHDPSDAEGWFEAASATCTEAAVPTARRARFLEAQPKLVLHLAYRAAQLRGIRPPLLDDVAQAAVLSYIEAGPRKIDAASTDRDVERVTRHWFKATTYEKLVAGKRKKGGVSLPTDEDGVPMEPGSEDLGSPFALRPESLLETVAAREQLAAIQETLPFMTRREGEILLDLLQHPDANSAESAARLDVTTGNVWRLRERARDRLLGTGFFPDRNRPRSGKKDPDDDGPEDGPGKGRKGKRMSTSNGDSRTEANAAATPATPATADGGATPPEPSASVASRIGALRLQGDDEAAAQLATSMPAAERRAAEREIAAVDGEAIDEAMPGFADAVTWFAAHPDPATVDPAIESAALGALRARHAAEALLEGASVLVGHSVEPHLDLEASLDAFDEVVRENLWALVPLNTTRRAQAMELAPHVADRCWWWTLGVDVPDDALLALTKAAQLLAVFPQARQELDRLIREARDRGASPPSKEVPPDAVGGGRGALPRGVVEFLRGLQARNTDADEEPGALPIFGAGDEFVVRDLDGVTLSVDDESLLVDYEESCEPDPLRPPTVEQPGAPTIEGIPKFEARFALPFATFRAEADRALLRVPRRGEEDLLVPIPWEEP